MNNFKKALTVLIVITAILILALTTISADEITPILSKEKDGLKAELSVSDLNIKLKLTNESATNVSNIKVNLTLPDGFELSEGNLSEALELSDGTSKELSFSVKKTEPEVTTPSDDPRGCKGAGASAVSVVVMIGIAPLLIKKNKKATLSCLMIVAVLFGSFAFLLPASAATTERSIELLGTFTYEETEYPVNVSIAYDHTFTETDLSKTTGLNRYEITYYCGPSGSDLNEENIKLIKEAGFTSIPVENLHGAGTENFKSALEIMRQYGLRCSALQDVRMTNLVYATHEVTQEEFDQAAKEIVEDYKDFLDIIDGWWIRDEPGADNFEKLGMAVKAFKKYTPDKETMINLFPTYASNDQLVTNGYQEYLDKFVRIVDPDYLSYDNYPFFVSNNKTNQFVGEYYNNLELVRNSMLKCQKDYMIILQLTKFGSEIGDVSYDELEWQVNVALSYGVKRISYFTYWLDDILLSLGWTNSCADKNGTIYPHYYDAQKVNKWLLSLGNELFDKTSTAVFHVKVKENQQLGNGCVAYTGYGDLGEINASHFVIGFFDDGSFMITNKYYDKIYNTIMNGDLSALTEADGALEYMDMTTGEWKDALADGIVTKDENGNYVKNEAYSSYKLFRAVKSENTFEFIDVKNGLEYFDTNTSTWRDAEADGVVTRNERGNLSKGFDTAEGMLFRVVD